MTFRNFPRLPSFPTAVLTPPPAETPRSRYLAAPYVPPPKPPEEFNERRDTLVVPIDLNIGALSGPSGELVKDLERKGKLIKLKYLFSPGIVSY